MGRSHTGEVSISCADKVVFFNLAFVVGEGRGNPNKNKSGLSYARYRNTILRMNAGLVA